MSALDHDRLEFPKDISETIGLHPTEIGFLKKKGCPFYGRKTTVRWVRDFLAKEAGALAPATSTDGHQQSTSENKSDAPSGSNDSRAALPRSPRARRDDIWK